MNYGLYLSASGTLNALYRMDVAANNLANSETTGFKSDITAAMARDAANPEDGLHLPSNKLLEKLGGGVLAGPNRTAWRQGALQTTNHDLDVGI
ncbi:MAG: flagellar basal body protein, partial [bacterium]